MNNKKKKIAAWFMVAIMLLSAFAGFAAYFIK